MRQTAAERVRDSQIAELLDRYDGLRILPSVETTTCIVGTIVFRAEGRATPLIEDSYEVRLEVPDNFPERMALVWETAGRIPATFHHLDNQALCLGSRVRLRLQMAGSPSVLRFVERCLIPYLYGYSHYARTGVVPFGELHHGELGSLQDLAGLLQVELAEAIPYCVLASMLRRRANKQPCPCRSGRRLGRCHNRKVNALRERVGRVFLQREMCVIATALRDARAQKAAAFPVRTRDWRNVLRDATSRSSLPTWAMPIRRSQLVSSPTP